MYRKVQAKNEPVKKREKDPEIVPPQLAQSFISCPKCLGMSLAKCDCPMANYLCQHCGWTHYTHRHGGPSKPQSYGKLPIQLLHSYTLPN